MKRLKFLVVAGIITLGMFLLISNLVDATGMPPVLNDGDGGWTHSGTYDEWEWGKPSNPEGSPHCAPNSPNGCWATDLDGDYENNCSQNLYSIHIPIPVTATMPVYVTWMQEWYAGSTVYDQLRAHYRCNEGPWSEVWRPANSNHHTWREVPGGPFRITCQSGDTVQLRYYLESDEIFTHFGYYVDEVRVYNPDGDLYFEDFESVPDYRTSTKTAPAALAADGTLEYTVVIANSGLLSGTATLTDPIPAGAEYVDGSAAVSPPGAGTLDDSDGITWTGLVPTGESITVTFRVHPTTYAGTLRNTAVISDSLISEPVTLTHALDLVQEYAASQKTGGAPTSDATIAYTVTLANDGNAPGLVTMTDPLPADTEYIPGSAAVVPANAGTLDDTNDIAWTGIVTHGAEILVTYQVRSLILTGDIDNTATISAATLTEPLVRQHYTTIDISPDYATSTKTAPAALDPDGTVEYTLGLYNSGIYTGTPTLIDPIPSGTEYVPGSAAVLPPGAGTLDDSNDITWTGELGGGERVTVTFRVSVTTAEGPITNTAVITDPLTEEPVTVEHVLPLHAELTDFTKVGSEPTPNGLITYTVALVNSGTLPAAATVSDPLPADTVYVAGSARTIPAGQGTLDDSAGIHWAGTVNAASTLSVTYQVRATIVTGTITNTAIISAPILAEPITRQHVTVIERHLIFLPLIIRN